MRLPPEFSRPRAGIAVRRGHEGRIEAWLDERIGGAVAPGRGGASSSSAARDAGARGVAAGRGTTRVVELDGERVFVRRYRHGGWLGGLLGDVYWQRPPRPWRELAATEAARRAGVLAPEVRAAAVLPLPCPWCWLYRGVLVTAALDGRRSLAEALRNAGSTAARGAWLEAAWATVERLHSAGIHHPDLNATNLLAASSPADALAVIDFDRAVVRRRPIGCVGRALARRRLVRSVSKLGLPGLDRRGVAARLRQPVTGAAG